MAGTAATDKNVIAGEAADAVGLRYPLKRVGERGEGKWQRVSWDEITEEIADKIIDIFEKYGPGKLMTHTGSGNLSMVRLAAPYRFASLVGGVQLDIFTDVGDLNTGAHYLWEAKYNGARVVSVVPDYNPSSIHADLWMPIKQGADPFLAMSFVNVIIEEGLHAPDFVKEQTDLVALVRDDNGKLLREADLKDGGSEEIFITGI